MQRSLQHSVALQAATARGVRRGAPVALRSSYVMMRKPKRVQAAQDGTVEAPDGASSAEAVVPMADSLIERAKLVVETGHVDEAFSDNFVPELESELTALHTRAEQAEAQATKMEEALLDAKDKFVRLQADFDNFRKRTAAEKDTLRASVRGDTVAALLPLVDNFELAKAQLKLETEGEKKVDAAYQGLYKQMVELFRGLGLEAVPGVGSPFDPNLHDAIMREPSEDVPDGTVLEEFRKGFTLGDKLLRPAMVKVSYSDTPAPAQAGGSDDAAAGEQAAAETQEAAATASSE